MPRTIKKTNFPLVFRTKAQRELIQRAARIKERGNVTQFILDAAETRAKAVIAERREEEQAALRDLQPAVNQ